MKSNVKDLIARLTCVLALCFAGLPLPAAAMDHCEKASAFHLLVAELKRLNWQSNQFSDHTIRRISRRASEVRLSQLAGNLEENGRISEKRTVIQVLNTASQISRARQVQDPEVLQRTLRAASRLIDAVCDGTLGLSDPNAAATQTWNRDSGGTIYALLNEASTLLKAVLYILALMSVIGAVFIGRAAYLYIYPFIYSRKSCRIKASVDFGTEGIHGHIVVIGKKGCRFEPSDKTDLKRIPVLLESNRAQLAVLDLAMPLNINGVSKNYISIFFEVRLSHARLAQILESSITRTHYVKKDIMEPNLDALMRP